MKVKAANNKTHNIKQGTDFISIPCLYYRLLSIYNKCVECLYKLNA